MRAQNLISSLFWEYKHFTLYEFLFLSYSGYRNPDSHKGQEEKIRLGNDFHHVLHIYKQKRKKKLKELDFPRKYKKDKAGERPTSDEVVREYPILDKDGMTHYFATYREKDKLCQEFQLK